MPVRERAALGVLAREPDRDPLDQQAREGERLGLAPVDAARVEGLAATHQLALELRVDREAFGHAMELLVQAAQAILGNRRHEVRRLRHSGAGRWQV